MRILLVRICYQGPFLVGALLGITTWYVSLGSYGWHCISLRGAFNEGTEGNSHRRSRAGCLDGGSKLIAIKALNPKPLSLNLNEDGDVVQVGVRVGFVMWWRP